MYFKFDKLLRQVLRHDYFCNVWSKKKLYVLLVALEKLSVLYFSFALNKGPAVKKKKKTTESLPDSELQVHSRLYSSKKQTDWDEESKD